MKEEIRTLIQSKSRVVLRQDGDSEQRTIAGTGAVFYDGTPNTEFQLDKDYVERIAPGAFDEALANDDVRGVFNHDASLILGRTAADTMRLSVDKEGLQYEIDTPDTSTGRDLQVSIERGDVTGSSFKFWVTSQEHTEEGDVLVRTIKNVKLFDVGPVTFPAYDATSASVRSEGAQESREAYEASKREDEDKLNAKLRQVSNQARIAEIS